MSEWTDQRVETLKRLWAEGLSASQIAAQFGDISRNAVIGKVHRLGLASRKTTTVKVPRKNKAHASQHSVEKQASRPASTVIYGNTLVAVEEEPQHVQSAQVVPIFPGVTLMELRPSTCKWPIGDPLSPGFRFCGARTENGSPYCGYHACLAYQPRAAGDRRRR
ncbi:GcrA family cell cycle regulator [Brucella intermedia]|uniref:GcrA family cell cycle regulator n=1 Tax=Brucella intermedia TaxID=94625 RepID=UPI002248B547|nr:GcrA family cell cycle regulator [Brucella intermedia]